MPMYILHDIYLKDGDLSAQIDYLVFTKKICFVIECKNLYGDIEINSAGDFVRTIEFGNRKKQVGHLSPTKVPGSSFFWHPSTSVIKLNAIKEGFNQPLVEAMNLKGGDKVLDCTLGMATDAIVFASIVGGKGKIFGTEVNKYIACITKNGLNDYKDVDEQTKIFMERIDVINSSYEEYILSQPDNSFNVVYFDPMFKRPNKKSVAINSLRPFAQQGELYNF